MKKLLVIAICALFMCGCVPATEENVEVITDQFPCAYVCEFQYKNHKYINFGCGIVHDPECPCMKKTEHIGLW